MDRASSTVGLSPSGGGDEENRTLNPRLANSDQCVRRRLSRSLTCANSSSMIAEYPCCAGSRQQSWQHSAAVAGGQAGGDWGLPGSISGCRGDSSCPGIAPNVARRVLAGRRSSAAIGPRSRRWSGPRFVAGAAACGRSTLPRSCLSAGLTPVVCGSRSLDCKAFPAGLPGADMRVPR
jgi:hypothetical protein